MDWFITQRDQLRAMFREFLPAVVTEAVMSLARPALRLGADSGLAADSRLGARSRLGADSSGAGGPRPAGPPAGRSRLGGPPLLPPGTPWPTWGDRRLDFVGVIDFGELASTLWLPELPGAGAVAFYYATELPRPWGDDPAQTDGWRVLPGADVPAGPARLPEVRLAAAPFISLPSPHEPALRPIGAQAAAFDETYPELYASWARFTWGDEPRHQTGGWPAVVQRAIWPDCARAAAGHPLDDVAPPTGATSVTAGPVHIAPGDVHAADAGQGEWRLLLQLDSDDRLGWLWGETGFVYFSARAADVRSGALDRSWLILQAIS